jgi:hypothetical protein
MHRLPLLLALCLVPAADTPIHPGCQGMIEDPAYDGPELGDTLRLGWNPVGTTEPTAANVTLRRFELMDWLKATALKDWTGRAEMKREGTVFNPPYGVPCLVLELEEVDIPKRPRPARIACVRITEGELRGKKVWVETWAVKRLIQPTKTPRP